MRPFITTDATRERLRQLSRLRDGPLARFRGSARTKFKQCVDEIRHADELSCVTALAQHLSSSRTLAQPVIDAIVAILDQRDPLQLAQLDEQCRRQSIHNASLFGWVSVDVENLPDLSIPLIAGLFSLHRNGYVREAAIRRLKQSPDPVALTFCLLRTNDWVPNVRRLATVEVIRRATTRNRDHLIANLTLIERCSQKERSDFSMAQAAIDNVLVQAPQRLEANLNSDDVRLRRAIYRLSARFENEDRARFVGLGLADSDLQIRTQSARAILRVSNDDQTRGLIDVALRDRFYVVRLIALRHCLDQPRDFQFTRLDASVLDRSRAVRTAARYRDALDNGQLVVGLAGLGECGRPEDAERVQAYLGDAHPRVAAAALDSLCRLSDADQAEHLLEHLGHTSARCSRHASVRLREIRSPVVHRACIRYIADAQRPIHVRRHALGILAYSDKWSSLEGILTAQRYRELRDLADLHRRQWHRSFNCSFTKPTPAQQQALVAAMDALALDPQQRQLLTKLMTQT